MKNFTYPQKKWVMTAALLAVLGMNVSFNSQKSGIASADFASTSADLVESKVYTSEGAMPVKYIANGETQVLAVVPKKMTEGKVCDNCGYDTIPLTVQNKSDIDSLNVALMKVLEGNRRDTKSSSATPEVEIEATEETKVARKTDYFKNIVSDCDSTTINESSSLNCITDKYLDILNDRRKSKNISANDAHQFYVDAIQPRLFKQIAQASSLGRASRDQVTSGIFDPDFDLRANQQKIQSLLEHTIFNMKEMTQTLPSKYELTRSKILVTQTEILKAEAVRIKDTMQQMERQQDPAHKARLTWEADSLLKQTNSYRQLQRDHTLEALLNARMNGTIDTQKEREYQSFIRDFDNQIAAALAGNNAAWLNEIKTTPTINLSGRVQNPGRGTGSFNSIGTLPNASVPTSQIGTLPQTNPNPLSSRTSSRGQ